jgi:hypothetical protein
VRFEVLKAAIMKMAVFWTMMEAASTSETSANYQTTGYNSPEDSHIYVGFLLLFVRNVAWL